MTINIYFSSALMGTISATVVAKSMHSRDINLLFVERANTFDEDYYALNAIIEKYFNWDRVFHIDREECPWPSKNNLLKYFSSVWKISGYYRSFGRIVNDRVRDFGPIDNIYTSMPSRFWCLIKDKKAKVSIIEHSIQEYNLLYSMSSKKYPISRLKQFFDFVVGYRQLVRFIPSKFVLMDGGRCSLLKHLECDKIPFFSIDAKSVICDILAFFEKEYKTAFSNVYDEIAKIRDQMGKFKNRYMYLPTGEVPRDCYGEYISHQIKDISLQDACVFIKSHPRDSADYSAFFKGSCSVFVMSNKINRLLPAEVLMVMLNMPKLWGSYSSALIYSYWWFGAIPILSVVDSSSVNQILLREYSNFLESEFGKFITN